MPASDIAARPLIWVGLALTLMGLWWSPVSPVALSRADVALGAGQPTLAVARYDAVARWTPVRSWRHRALDRAARVLSSELNDPSGARIRTRRLLAEQRTAQGRAETLARMAHLFQLEGRSTRAATEWLSAVDFAPTHPQAAQWWAKAAASLADAGKIHRASKQWEALLRAHPERRVEANLARARLALADGRTADALPLFDDVVRHGSASEQAAGRLGASICLERLGDLDEALAAMDQASLPDTVRESREHVLKQRAQWAP